MMSIEKCIALYFPFKTRNICTVRTAKWASGIVFVVFCLLDSFWFFAIKAIRGMEELEIWLLFLRTFLQSIFWFITK